MKIPTSINSMQKDDTPEHASQKLTKGKHSGSGHEDCFIDNINTRREKCDNSIIEDQCGVW